MASSQAGVCHHKPTVRRRIVNTAPPESALTLTVTAATSWLSTTGRTPRAGRRVSNRGFNGPYARIGLRPACPKLIGTAGFTYACLTGDTLAT
jgi:hypothetical protein